MNRQTRKMIEHGLSAEEINIIEQAHESLLQRWVMDDKDILEIYKTISAWYFARNIVETQIIGYAINSEDNDKIKSLFNEVLFVHDTLRETAKVISDMIDENKPHKFVDVVKELEKRGCGDVGMGVLLNCNCEYRMGDCNFDILTARKGSILQIMKRFKSSERG